MLTGLRPDTTRILENNIAPRDTMPDVVTLPQLFRNNKWRSIRAGKMYHMDVPGSVGTNKWDDPPSWDTAVSPPGAEQNTAGEGRNFTEGRLAGWRYTAFKGDGKDQADERATRIVENYDPLGVLDRSQFQRIQTVALTLTWSGASSCLSESFGHDAGSQRHA